MTSSEIKNQTIELFKQLEAGDLSARNKIAELNLNLAYEVANSFPNIAKIRSYVDKDDIIQLARVGLLKAIDKFRLALGYNFATFATACMKNEIFMANRSLTNSREDAILNSPLKEAENIEFGDLIIGSESAEDTFLKEEGGLFDATVKLLPECDRRFLTMRFKLLATPQQIGAELNFDPQIISKLETDILRCIKKRMHGSSANSVLYQRYLYNNDVASFKKEFYEKLPPKQKSYFDQTVLADIPKSNKDVQDEFGSVAKAAIVQRGIAIRLDTFLARNILKIERMPGWDLGKPFQQKFPKAMANQEVILPALGKKEKLVFDECVVKNGKELKDKRNLIRYKKGLIKKFTIFENNQENNEKIENKLLF